MQRCGQQHTGGHLSNQHAHLENIAFQIVSRLDVQSELGALRRDRAARLDLDILNSQKHIKHLKQEGANERK